jgi:hypothetical protein
MASGHTFHHPSFIPRQLLTDLVSAQRGLQRLECFPRHGITEIQSTMIYLSRASFRKASKAVDHPTETPPTRCTSIVHLVIPHRQYERRPRPRRALPPPPAGNNGFRPHQSAPARAPISPPTTPSIRPRPGLRIGRKTPALPTAAGLLPHPPLWLLPPPAIPVSSLTRPRDNYRRAVSVANANLRPRSGQRLCTRHSAVRRVHGVHELFWVYLPAGNQSCAETEGV